MRKFFGSPGVDYVNLTRIQLLTMCVKGEHGGATKRRPCYMYICGCHVYSVIREAAIGGELACEREPHKAQDHYAENISHVYSVVLGDHEHFARMKISQIMVCIHTTDMHIHSTATY